MNAALVALLFVAVAITSTSATTLPDCTKFTCNPDTCPQRQCACGTYKDACGCCDVCYKCPGAECNLWILDACTNDHKCVLEDPAKPFEIGGVGHCTPTNATDASHTS
ncbi:8.6 kDa transglutaminase substrate-like [Dermacentor albipictus]|uniref:8.6 kDa transglutaminase substrate-like n=1 Tax=Dermacentor albipictus TaxID=60249 RepID=UPI0038FBFAEC